MDLVQHMIDPVARSLPPRPRAPRTLRQRLPAVPQLIAHSHRVCRRLHLVALRRSRQVRLVHRWQAPQGDQFRHHRVARFVRLRVVQFPHPLVAVVL